MSQVAADPAFRRKLERRPLGQHPLQLEFEVADRLAITGVWVGRVMHDKGVERITVPRRMDLGFENRELSPAEKSANARKKLLLVGQIDHQLQPGAVARESRLDDWLLAVDPVIQLPRMPGDVAGAVPLEIDDVQTLPQAVFGALRNCIQAQLARGLRAP